jgi:pectin methylesterase-like acyl-CoA thioesterase
MKNSIIDQTNSIEMNGVAYETIAAALAAIPTSGDTSTYTIRLNKGTYNENGLSYNGTASIHIIGNTNTKYGTDVIIKGRGNNMSSMRGRELLEIQGTGNIILENVSLVSDYSRSESTKDAQAEVLGTDTKGNTVAYNCSFISHQDTLRTAGKAWFYGCYVEGDTDFIWMEAAGSVALYENCEIVSVYDEYATTHTSYVTAPRMGVSSKVGKGLVFLNSTIRESEEAKAKGQLTYLARSPWTSGYFNQVAFINTICSDVEVESSSKAPNAPWFGNMIETEYPQTIIGWKMDSKTAASLNISGKDYIIDDAITNKEFSFLFVLNSSSFS